jgi:hypothetical protein
MSLGGGGMGIDGFASLRLIRGALPLGQDSVPTVPQTKTTILRIQTGSGATVTLGTRVDLAPFLATIPGAITAWRAVDRRYLTRHVVITYPFYAPKGSFLEMRGEC